MARDPRWESVWASVTVWREHPDWWQFCVEVGPGRFAEQTYVHRDDLAMAPAAYGGTLGHLVRALDERLADSHRPEPTS